MKRVTVIGGGVGGLSAAIRLRLAGYNVSLYEKNNLLGGKLASRTTAGGYVDLGPTLLTMVSVFEDLFEAAGENLHEQIELQSIDPSCRYHWSDGTILETWADRDRLLEEVERLFPDDTRAMSRFLDDVAMLFDAIEDIFLTRPFRGMRELVTLENLRLGPLLGKMGFTSSMMRSLRSRFKNEKLIQLLARFATYNGSSPYHAPATLNLIAHVELSLGAWYPAGGMIQIAKAMEWLARRVGVEIEMGVEVRGVRLDQSKRRVISVEFAGDSAATDVVVSNVDVRTTWDRFLVPAGLSVPRRLHSSELSCSGFLITGGVASSRSEKVPAHHELYFSDDYRREFQQIFDDRVYPEEMTVYRSIPSIREESGEDNLRSWYLLVNAPSGLVQVDRESYTERVLARLRTFGVEGEWVDREVLGPEEIASRYGSAEGAIYGGSSNSIFSAFLRPTNRMKALENFYLVGGSVHPGGGLPLVTLSGKIVSDEISTHHPVSTIYTTGGSA